MASQTNQQRKLVIIAGIFALVGFILLIVGIVLLTKSKSKDCDLDEADNDKEKHRQTDRCSYSAEAELAGVGDFLRKVQYRYFELHPQKLIFKPGGVKPEEMKEKFQPYNPDPKNLKHITDAARALLLELKEMSINARRLKPRENKSLAQVKHFLENNFGIPFDGDYYAGDFLMGPNLFCWQSICNVGSTDIKYGLGNLRPKSLSDVRLVQGKMKLVAKAFTRYIDNLRFGIKAGMVRSKEECIAGINSFKREYFSVSMKGDIGMWEYSTNQISELSCWEHPWDIFFEGRVSPD